MRFRFFLFFCLFIIFFGLGLKVIDPDFGWQLRNGQTFLTSGIFYKDPYSYTMPSFPVVSHEWGSDIIFSLIYKLGGFYALAFLFAMIYSITLLLFFYFFAFQGKAKKFLKKTYLCNIAIFIFSTGNFLIYYYIRAQIFSWICWEILILVLINKKFNKYLVLLPFLFLVWANLHGGFAIGIVFVFLNAFFSTVKEKRIMVREYIVAIICLIATLFNPFGISLWREVLSTFFNSNLRVNIEEWGSIISYGFTFLDFLLFLNIFTSAFLVWYFRKKISFELIFYYIILLFLGLTSIKNIPFWIIFNLALLPFLISLLYEKISKNRISLTRFKVVSIFLFVFSTVLFGLLYYFYMNSVKVTFNFYPQRAVNYLKKDLPNGQIFSQYNWGGYLIWKMPQRKVFIDGRMAVWSFKPTNKNETENAFKDYLDILSGKLYFNDVAKKYNINTVLWSTQIKQTDSQEQVSSFMCKYIFLNSCLFWEQNAFGQRLLKEGWKIVYQDNIAVIYKR